MLTSVCCQTQTTSSLELKQLQLSVLHNKKTNPPSAAHILCSFSFKIWTQIKHPLRVYLLCIISSQLCYERLWSRTCSDCKSWHDDDGLQLQLTVDFIEPVKCSRGATGASSRFIWALLTPCICKETKKKKPNKDLKNQGKELFSELLYFYSNNLPLPRGNNLWLCCLFCLCCLCCFKRGGKGLTLCSTRGPCASLQCTQLVPFHHTHSKHIQTQL